MNPLFPVNLLINTPAGLLPLTPERFLTPMPRGPEESEPLIYYGPFLHAVADFLSSDGFEPLKKALQAHVGRPVSRRKIRKLDIVSEKHGGLYHVVSLTVVKDDCQIALVANVAVTPEQQSVLASEFQLLQRLQAGLGHSSLPRAYVMGKAAYAEVPGSRRELGIFIGEWFEGFHEHHLSYLQAEWIPVIKVWGAVDFILNPSQAGSFYRKAAAILTRCFDERTFEQIYPWHHAAGDFIVKPESSDEVDVRLITVRGYRRLVDLEPGEESFWIGLTHFFLNLTLRMRLDRLNGTGKLMWAGPDCLRDVLASFLQAWAEKQVQTPDLPSREDILEVLRSFAEEELFSLAELALEDGLLDVEEDRFMRTHLEEHIRSLHATLLEEHAGLA
jgi:hypothetical protein